MGSMTRRTLEDGKPLNSGSGESLNKRHWTFPKYRIDEDFDDELWTVDANTTLVWETTNIYLGTSSEAGSITTINTNRADFISPDTYGLDLTDRELYIAVYAEDWATVDSLAVFLSNDNGFVDHWKFNLTTAVTKQFVNGEWNLISVTPGSSGGLVETVGSPSWDVFNKIQIGIKRVGSTDTTVLIGGLISIPRSSVGAISLLFDDGFQGVYNLGLPILKKYGLTASIMMIGSKIGDGAGHMTLAELKDWEKNGNEVCSHSSETMVGLSEELNIKQLKTARAYIEKFKSPDIFAYVGGSIDTNLVNASADVFSMARTSGVKWSEVIPPGDRRIVKTWAYLDADTLATLQTAVGLITTYHNWLIISFHNVVSSGASGTDISTSDLDALCSTIATELANADVSMVNIGDMPEFIKKQLKS